MRFSRAIVMLTAAAALAAPAGVSAQSADVGLNTAGLVSFQPIDSTYVGPSGPYLDRGLGGVGPGFSVGLDVAANQLALMVEYSTAWLSAVQQGRLVDGGHGTGRLRDSMLTGLAGAQVERTHTLSVARRRQPSGWHPDVERHPADRLRRRAAPG